MLHYIWLSYMKNLSIQTIASEYDNVSELTSEDQGLLQAATDAAGHAYAPYSQFYVGAALLLESGIIVKGNNQENVAYPSGLCAERVAIFSAGAQFPDIAIRSIAITCQSKLFEVKSPVSPCGACRQAMVEYEVRHNCNIRLITMGETGKIRIFESVKALLPFMFIAEELKKPEVY